MKRIFWHGALYVGLGCVPMGLMAAEMPRVEKKAGRYAMMVDGKPLLLLGVQINNSSSFASELPKVWPALEAAHVNTIEAPVYWELMEPEKGKFDFANVDLLVEGARAHHLRLVLLWFGTWKNGQAHYVPAWMKRDTKMYPRVIGARGKMLDVMSPNSSANLEADKSAYAALMRHLREVDGTEHTVILMQVENESGTIGAVGKRRPHNDEVHGSRSSRVPLSHPVLVTVAPDAEFISAFLEWAGEN